MTRGPYTIRGYYDAAEQNAAAFTADGFYRMGDIVRRSGRHVFAEGRRKDFINRGGFLQMDRPLEMLPAVLDLLRHESPLFLRADGTLASSSEPAGEEERRSA